MIAGPLLATITGKGESAAKTENRALAENIPSSRGREDYVRVRVSGEKVFPEFGKSGLMNTLIRSDGQVRIPAGSEGLEKGEIVEVLLW